MRCTGCDNSFPLTGLGTILRKNNENKDLKRKNSSFESFFGESSFKHAVGCTNSTNNKEFHIALTNVDKRLVVLNKRGSGETSGKSVEDLFAKLIANQGTYFPLGEISPDDLCSAFNILGCMTDDNDCSCRSCKPKLKPAMKTGNIRLISNGSAVRNSSFSSLVPIDTSSSTSTCDNNLTSRVANLEARVSSLESENINLTSRVSDLEARVSSLESINTTTMLSLKELTDRVNVLQSQLYELVAAQSKVSTSESTASKFKRAKHSSCSVSSESKGSSESVREEETKIILLLNCRLCFLKFNKYISL